MSASPAVLLLEGVEDELVVMEEDSGTTEELVCALVEEVLPGRLVLLPLDVVIDPLEVEPEVPELDGPEDELDGPEEELEVPEEELDGPEVELPWDVVEVALDGSLLVRDTEFEETSLDEETH